MELARQLRPETQSPKRFVRSEQPVLSGGLHLPSVGPERANSAEGRLQARSREPTAQPPYSEPTRRAAHRSFFFITPPIRRL